MIGTGSSLKIIAGNLDSRDCNDCIHTISKERGN